MTAAALSGESFAELRQTVDELVRGARAALGVNFRGAYLVGSFALGAGDEHSDVDFLIITNGDLDAGQVHALRQLHAAYPDRGGWARHLEGSYVPAAELRRAATDQRHWWYVDNGSRELLLSPHDNTEVGRWVLRERGVVLAGPPSAELVEVVAEFRLRREALGILDTWQAIVDDDPGFPPNDLAQQQHVLGLCRVLYTLTAATVVSKAAAGRWALLALEPRWSDLIARAIRARPAPWERVHQPPDPDLALRTREFGDYARSFGRQQAREDGSTATPARPDTGPSSERREGYDATEPLVLAEVRRLISSGQRDRLLIDDLRRDDLDRIPWSGGPRHPLDVGEALDRRTRGEIDYLAVRAPNGWPVCIGGIDYMANPDAGTLWQLSTHPALVSLGLGTRLIGAAEDRIRQRGLRIAVIGVEDTNSRAHALYTRLGYFEFDHEHATWDEVDEHGTPRVHHAEVILMRKVLDDRGPAGPD